MGQFGVPTETAKRLNQQHIGFINGNKKIDVITGQVQNKNFKSSGYEGYTENSQARVSGNKSYMPQDLFVCDPITGRKIIRK